MLGENKKNKVITYDINSHVLPEVKNHIIKEFPNIKFELQSCLEIPLDVLQRASFIHFDIAPHDGVQEPLMLQRIRDSGFSGLLACDDLAINDDMWKWWCSITDQTHEVEDECCGANLRNTPTNKEGVATEMRDAHNPRTGFIFFSEEIKSLLK